MRKINPKKFINIPWTATNPHNREKHFHVHSLIHQRGGLITAVRMQAVVSGTDLLAPRLKTLATQAPGYAGGADNENGAEHISVRPHTAYTVMKYRKLLGVRFNPSPTPRLYNRCWRLASGKTALGAAHRIRPLANPSRGTAFL